LTDFEKAHVGEKPEKGMEEQGKQEEQGDSGMQGDLVKSNSLQESVEPRLLTTNASSIDRHLQEFLPGMATDVCERYCAALLWTSSGLVQEAQAEEIARWLVLRENEPVRVAETFADLKHLQDPWMQGREGTDGKWERQVREALQLEKLGRFIFAMLLSYIREKVAKEPSRALEGFKLLSDTIRQWDAETDEKRLERQFLLKELFIGRRHQHLPSWSGGVTKMGFVHINLKVKGPVRACMRQCAMARRPPIASCLLPTARRLQSAPCFPRALAKPASPGVRESACVGTAGCKQGKCPCALVRTRHVPHDKPSADLTAERGALPLLSVIVLSADGLLGGLVCRMAASCTSRSRRAPS
jgi:hypothetical protein